MSIVFPYHIRKSFLKHRVFIDGNEYGKDKDYGQVRVRVRNNVMDYGNEFNWKRKEQDSEYGDDIAKEKRLVIGIGLVLG